MDSLLRVAAYYAQTVFYVHAINLLIFILYEYTPVLMLALDDYFSRLLEIWPALEFFSESLKKKDLDVGKEDMVWDTGWQPQIHQPAILNILNFIRHFTCLIFLPQYHRVSLGMNKFINIFCYYLKSFYEFLTVDRFIYLCLTVFFAIKFLSGPFTRFKNNRQREKNDDASTRGLSS